MSWLVAKAHGRVRGRPDGLGVPLESTAVKLSPLAVVFLAVGSSLLTVGAIELLRNSWSAPEAAQKVGPGAKPPAAPASRLAGPPVPASTAPADLAAYEERLAKFERRILALEQNRASRRVLEPSAADGAAQGDELRELVLGWVAEDREARRRAAELEQEEARQKERGFDARYQAHLLALEHDLPEWEEERLGRLFLEIESRRGDLEGDIDPLTDDPKEVERRFVEFDEWAERRQLEELGQELYERLFGGD